MLGLSCYYTAVTHAVKCAAGNDRADGEVPREGPSRRTRGTHGERPENRAAALDYARALRKNAEDLRQVLERNRGEVMSKLKTHFLGFELENPWCVASAPPAATGELM